MTDLVLGIDGGGSKTRALLANRSGEVIGIGVAASSNYQSVGFAAATAALDAAIAAAFDEAGIVPAPIRAACFGLAGVDRPEDQQVFNRWLHERGIVQRWSFVNDAELVLAAGTPGGWGVALICGTGSICYGRAPDGRETRAGGWGHVIGDEGSGYDIGVQALRLATQTADGRADAHALLEAILDHWSLEEPSQLISFVYRPETTRAIIAALAQRVDALAEAGDSHAQRLLDHAGAELGRAIAAVVRKLALDHPPLALGGGLLGGSRRLQAAVMQHAQVALGPSQHVSDPATGALVLARRLIEAES